MDAPQQMAPEGGRPLPEFAEAVDGETDRLLRIAAWLPRFASGLSSETGITVRTLLAAFLFGEDPVSRWFQENSSSIAPRVLGRLVESDERSKLTVAVAAGALPEFEADLRLFSPSARTILRKARWIARRVSQEPGEALVAARHVLAVYAFLPDGKAYLEAPLREAFAGFLFGSHSDGRPVIGADAPDAWKGLMTGHALTGDDRRLIAAIDRNEPVTAFEMAKRATDPRFAIAAFAVAADLGHPDAPMVLEGLRPSAAPPTAPAPAPPTELIANLGNDDPDAPGLEDQLRVEDEARAFARLAASKTISPPLAIGVFGEWGSGKSFFMRLIREHISRLAASARAKRDRAQQSGYLADIVQIRFNAWHYMESNLWASLVDTIFTELDRWITERTDDAGKTDEFMSRLATARQLTLEAAAALVDRRKEQAAAADRLSAAERELSQARAAAALSPREVANAFADVFKAEIANLQADGRRALAATGLDTLQTNAEGFKSALDQLTDERRRASVIAAQMVQQLGSWPTAGLVIALVAGLPTVLALLTAGLGAAAGQPWLESVSTLAVPAAGFLGGATLTVQRLLSEVRPHLDRLTQLNASLNAALAAKLATEEQQRLAAVAEVAEKSAAAERARAELQAATAALAAAMEAYTENTGSRRLRRFIRERAADGTYAKHLGLIATIRRDFEQLSFLMLNRDETAESKRRRELYEKHVETLIEDAGDHLSDDEKNKLREGAQSLRDAAAFKDARFERVILYIDDLDRCPPAKVVDVLQAIHLLLYFRLFVVVVAVDARWVARSLKEVYPELLAETVIRPGTGEHGAAVRSAGDRSDAAPASIERAASSQDYLEKIFQIPYWVRRMEEEASRDYIGHIAGRAVLRAETGSPEAIDTQPAPQTAEAGVEPPAPRDGASGDGTAEAGTAQPLDDAKPAPAPQADGATEELTAVAFAEEEAAATYLEQDAAEITMMKALAPFVGGTPRRGLRFVNVYRLIKTGLPAATREALVDEAGQALGYRALLTQIAIVTGSPRSALPYFDLLAGADQKPVALPHGADLPALIARCREPAALPEDIDKANLIRTLEALEARNREDKVSTGADLVAHLRDLAPLAARYAFTARRH
ncbi:MAG: P-loop NTPase fold protein [Rhodospirillales bacterium]|nr:P-loop NTPase fold protein [Rhodospirillales bacterium]